MLVADCPGRGCLCKAMTDGRDSCLLWLAHCTAARPDLPARLDWGGQGLRRGQLLLHGAPYLKTLGRRLSDFLPMGRPPHSVRYILPFIPKQWLLGTQCQVLCRAQQCPCSRRSRQSSDRLSSLLPAQRGRNGHSSRVSLSVSPTTCTTSGHLPSCGHLLFRLLP